MVVLLYSSTSSFLSPSKCLRLRVVLKKYKECSHIYGKPFRFIFPPNVMYEYLKLNLDFWNFFLYFTANWMKLSLCAYNLSTMALGQEYKCFLYWTRNKRSLVWLVYPSFIIVVALCSVSLTRDPVNDSILLKNLSKQI